MVIVILNIIKIRYAVIILLLCTLLNGCTKLSLTPRSIHYKQPKADIPLQWQQESGRTIADNNGIAVANKEQWWKSFNDPVLDYLIDLSLRTNNDLAAATIRVRRALLQLKLTNTNFSPSTNLSTDSGHSYDLKNSNGTTSSSIVGNLSYELDLWGKLDSLTDEARWEAEATEADRQSTALSLIGTTASAYWKIAFLNQQVASSEASIAYAEQTLDLVQVRYRNGAVSRLDLVQAQQSVESQKAGLSRLLMQRNEARNTLAILFNNPPENTMPERNRLPDGELPVIESGMPAEILGTRPDVRAAELRLRGSLANIDATRASFYPTFTLTGSFGSSSNTLINVLKNPIASLGAGVVLPFVQWNTMNLTIKASETEYEEAVVNFRQKLYNALSEVENALSANIHYHEESIYLEQALSLAKEAEKILEVRYHSGATSMQSWLDAQESRRAAEMSVAENRLNTLVNIMKLYQAIGGSSRL